MFDLLSYYRVCFFVSDTGQNYGNTKRLPIIFVEVPQNSLNLQKITIRCISA